MAMRYHSPCSPEECPAPYPLLTRRERSRDLAQRRRSSNKSLMEELSKLLPLPDDVITQMDSNSRLRVASCFFRMKMLMASKRNAGVGETRRNVVAMETKGQVEGPSLYTDMVQELITEALDGFIMVTLLDGTIAYVSESIHKHLGLFHSEHIGGSLYDLVPEDDHDELKKSMASVEAETVCKMAQGSPIISFFCHMKCSRFKMTNTIAKSGYKLVFVSGHLISSESEHFFVAMVRPVTPPSVLEVKMEYNIFVTHYSLELKCTYYDGRLQQLHGYSKEDLIGHAPFKFHHHDDIDVTLECSRWLMTKGEGLSGYYRYLTHHGTFIWMQSRATMMYDSRTGNPSYIVCVNFIINNDIGEQQLTLHQVVSGTSGVSYVHHPFPVSCGDGVALNPLDDGGGEEEQGAQAPPTKWHDSLLEELLSSAGLSPSTICPSPNPCLRSITVHNTHVEAALAQSEAPPPPPPLSPFSDSGYSSMSLQLTLPIQQPFSATHPSPPQPPLSTTPSSPPQPHLSATPSSPPQPHLSATPSSPPQPHLSATPSSPPQPHLSATPSSPPQPHLSATPSSPPQPHLSATPPSPPCPPFSATPSPPPTSNSTSHQYMSQVPTPPIHTLHTAPPPQSSSPFCTMPLLPDQAPSSPPRPDLRRHSPSKVIGRDEDMVANARCGGSRPHQEPSSSSLSARMDISHSHLTPSCGGVASKDVGTGASQWVWHDIDVLPILMQDDLNVLDLLEPMNF